MDGFQIYSYGTAAWLALQAVPLMISPAIINAILSPEIHQLSSLDEYLSRSLGIALFTLSLLCVLLTGSFPLTASSADPLAPLTSTSPSDPYATPTIIITVIYHSFAAFYSYARYNRMHQSGFVLGAVGSGALAAMGLWCILFGGSSKISKRTGADKRTSGWPFGNSEANKKRVGKKAL